MFFQLDWELDQVKDPVFPTLNHFHQLTVNRTTVKTSYVLIKLNEGFFFSLSLLEIYSGKGIVLSYLGFA